MKTVVKPIPDKPGLNLCLHCLFPIKPGEVATFIEHDEGWSDVYHHAPCRRLTNEENVERYRTRKAKEKAYQKELRRRWSLLDEMDKEEYKERAMGERPGPGAMDLFADDINAELPKR